MVSDRLCTRAVALSWFPPCSTWQAVGARSPCRLMAWGCSPAPCVPGHLLTDHPTGEHGQVSVWRCEAEEGLDLADLAAWIVMWSGGRLLLCLGLPAQGQVWGCLTLGLWCPLVFRLYYCRRVFTFTSNLNGVSRLSPQSDMDGYGFRKATCLWQTIEHTWPIAKRIEGILFKMLFS